MYRSNVQSCLGPPDNKHKRPRVASLTVSREGPAMLIIERLGHRVAESGREGTRVDKADALLRGMMLSKGKSCQTTVRLRVSTVELLKDTGEQRLVRVAAGERHPDFAYGDAHQCAHLEQFEPDGLALRRGHRSAVQTPSPKGFQQQVCDRREVQP